MLLIGMSLLAQAQQHGSISGTITTADGQPAEFVNVIIVGTNKATNTDTNGKFEIKRVTPGSYTLQVSFIGFDPKEQSVEVTAGQSTTAQFVLNETSQELDAIEVHGERINKFTRNESDYVSKMPLKNLENPSYPPKSVVVAFQTGSAAVAFKGRVARNLPPGAFDAIRPTSSSIAPEGFQSVWRHSVTLPDFMVGRDRVAVSVRPVLR